VRNGEPHVIRFKTPREGSTVVKDILRGEIKVENQNLDDFIIVKSDGWALYHLAAMVDDYEMKISHVIRGSEWLPTFPLHALLIRALGWQEPEFVHLSVFLKPSGKGKMSKRESADLIKDGYSIFVSDLQGLGYVPEAVVNWIALMGWSYDGSQEFFKMPELIEKFSLDKLNPAPAAINFTKLDHFAGLHIRSMTSSDLAGRVKPFFVEKGFAANDETLQKIAPIIQERIVTLDEAPEMAGFFFNETVDPPIEDLVAKGLTAQESAGAAQKCLDVLVTLAEITPATAEEPLRLLVEEMGLKAGQVFGILRVAVTGQKVSPPLFESMEIIGKQKTLERIQTAIERLKSVPVT
jgi:glutamyl-tRNA synthetase